MHVFLTNTVGSGYRVVYMVDALMCTIKVLQLLVAFVLGKTDFYDIKFN